MPADGQWRNLGERGLVVVEVIPFRGAPTVEAHYDSDATPEALVLIFLSYGEDFLRSSLGPGWLELPIFPPRRVNQQ